VSGGSVQGRGDFPVLRPVPTRWSDNDHYGHVNNVAYHSFVDTAVNGWLMAAAGTDVRQLPAIGLVVETRLSYLRPLSFPDPVVVGLALERLGTSSVAYATGVFRGEDAEPAALGRFVHVYVDLLSRATVAVPLEVRAALAAAFGSPSPG